MDTNVEIKIYILVPKHHFEEGHIWIHLEVHIVIGKIHNQLRVGVKPILYNITIILIQPSS